MRYITILLFCTVILFSQEGHIYKSEIIVRTPNNFKNITDVKQFIKACKNNHIDSISLLCKQDEDDEFDSGTVFYPSKIAPVAKGYERVDLIKSLISFAHKNHIKVKAWIPQFHDKVAFYTDEKWQMMVYREGKVKPYITQDGEYFVNPLHPQVQRYELSIIEEIVSNYDFDAVVLDWVRFDGYAMDLSNQTREDFKKDYGFDPLFIDFTHNGKERELWNSYRSNKIAAYIEKVKRVIYKKKPTLPLGVYLLSPAWLELAQDPSKFKNDLDFISVMCYFDDWGYPLNWIYDKKRDDAILPLVRQQVGDMDIIPVLDVDWENKTYNKLFNNLDKIKEISFFNYGKWTPLLLKKISSLTKK
jgi:uncharacterized lipoprotein YddW (UPF0748 family)